MYQVLKVNIIYPVGIKRRPRSLVISGAYFLANITNSVREILRLQVSFREKAPCVNPNNLATSV